MIAKYWKQLKCLSVGEGVNCGIATPWSTRQQYKGTGELLRYRVIWMVFKGIILTKKKKKKKKNQISKGPILYDSIHSILETTKLQR